MRSTITLLTFAATPLLWAMPQTASAWGWGEHCKFEAERVAAIESKGVEKVVIRAGAGDLHVTGRSDALRIAARGKACAPKQELLDRAQITVRREGNVVYLETDLPQNSPNAGWSDNDYATIDLGIALPKDLPVEAVDSSGDAVFEGLKALQVTDSSGDLRVSEVAELAEISDSSGDLEVSDVGRVRLNDSSGDVAVERVRGDVEVLVDSSGDMRIENIDGAVVVQSDSSGGLYFEEVKGSVTVNSDSSGDIRAASVGGDFTVNQDSSGSIDYERITGRVNIPSDKRDGRGDDVER
jgi:hypothetical protein